jgi:SAM-dependent methyltransferase
MTFSPNPEAPFYFFVVELGFGVLFGAGVPSRDPLLVGVITLSLLPHPRKFGDTDMLARNKDIGRANVRPPPLRDPQALADANRRFYDPLWRDARLVEPERFNTWPLVRPLAARARSMLEVAPGLRPRLPLSGTCFVDFSRPAVAKLRAHGATALQAVVTALPFADRCFDLLCALDIIEHVEDDRAMFAELARVAAPGATLLMSAPLHPGHWSAFDEFVGHRRRYEPQSLLALIEEQGCSVEQSAVYGMRPDSTRLLDLGMWFLTHRRERAMWWYNHVIMPLGVRLQKELRFVPGMAAAPEVDELILVCRKC